MNRTLVGLLAIAALVPMPPCQAAAGQAASLETLRAEYNRAAQKLEDEKQQKLGALAGPFLRQLTELKDRLVAQDKLEEALKVKAEIEQMRAGQRTQPGPQRSAGPQVGTWNCVSSIYGGEAGDLQQFMMITETHWVAGEIDRATMRLKRATGGGSCSLSDGIYTESSEFGGPAGVDTPNKFNVRFEGDKMFKSGVLLGKQLEQVFQRVKPGQISATARARTGVLPGPNR